MLKVYFSLSYLTNISSKFGNIFDKSNVQLFLPEILFALWIILLRIHHRIKISFLIFKGLMCDFFLKGINNINKNREYDL